MQCEESSVGIDHAPVVLGKDPEQEVPPGNSFICSGVSVQGVNRDEPFCRICHEGSGAEDLLSPCKCAGSLAMVHRVCLENWLTTSGTNHCELCHYQYALEKHPKPITEWFTAPGMRHQRQTLCGDVICFLFITPLASLSGWLCVQGAMDLYYSNGMKAIGLVVLTMTLFTIYLFWTLNMECNESQRPTPESRPCKDASETKTSADAHFVPIEKRDCGVVPGPLPKDLFQNIHTSTHSNAMGFRKDES